jgi:hypothetical protein
MLGPKELNVTILRVRGAVNSLSYHFFSTILSPNYNGTNDGPSRFVPFVGNGLIAQVDSPVSLENSWSNRIIGQV